MLMIREGGFRIMEQKLICFCLFSQTRRHVHDAHGISRNGDQSKKNIIFCAGLARSCKSRYLLFSVQRGCSRCSKQEDPGMEIGAKKDLVKFHFVLMIHERGLRIVKLFFLLLLLLPNFADQQARS